MKEIPLINGIERLPDDKEIRTVLFSDKDARGALWGR